jgi:uncharacterized protein YndB with AHSA1/START domain
MTQQTTETGPVLKTVTVSRPVEEAFHVFTEDMGAWWPLGRYSVDPDRAEDVVLEPKVGGRLYERRPDGRADWGEVLAWDPPARLVFTWHPGRGSEEATEVEVRFTASAGGTLVELEHRGWEILGERAAAVRSSYEQGWPGVLDDYAKHARTP